MTSHSAFMRTCESHFLEAMRDGYAKPGTAKKPIDGLPGSKSVTWTTRDPWKVVDCYFVNPDFLDSTGLTVVYFEDRPVWMMHYHGYYEPDVIPFLKRCLATAYLGNHFNGGRGPDLAEEQQLRYINNVRDGSTFEKFEGEELIRNSMGGTLGKHWYYGGTMLTRRR